MTKWFLLFGLLLGQSSWGQFSKGSVFGFVSLEGALTIQCPTKSTVTVCRESFLEPWPYDYFIGPLNPNATAIEFRASSESDSGLRRAEVSYNGSTGKSKEVNLGVSSLFQKPLLRIGLNNVEATLLSRKKEILEKIKFTVRVNREKNRSCEDVQVIVGTDADCEYSYSICQQYFTEMNYCRK